MSQMHSSLNRSVLNQNSSNPSSSNPSSLNQSSLNLNNWLHQATRHLSKDSAAQVRGEIQEHYESARDTAISSGASAEEADESAVVALGDAKTANCQYRNVLLTSREARLLRESQWESRAVCSRPWLKWLLLAMPAAALWASAALFINGKSELARTLLVGGVTLLLAFGAPFLPIYTPARARIFRRVKYVLLLATFALVFGRNALDWSWLLACSVWPLFWIESTRTSIRRKLPEARWPKHLYL
jgi:hypothetical protein